VAPETSPSNTWELGVCRIFLYSFAKKSKELYWLNSSNFGNTKQQITIMIG
jgi:hypothetical protein